MKKISFSHLCQCEKLAVQANSNSVFKYANLIIFLLGPLGFLKQTLFNRVFNIETQHSSFEDLLVSLSLLKTLYSTLKLTNIDQEEQWRSLKSAVQLHDCGLLAWFACRNSQNLSNLRKQHTLHIHCLRFAEINIQTCLSEITFNFTFKIDNHGLQQRKPTLSHFLLDLVFSVSEQ